MRGKKKRSLPKRAAALVCSIVMAGSVLLVNTNSASWAYASDVLAEQEAASVNSDENTGSRTGTETNAQTSADASAENTQTEEVVTYSQQISDKNITVKAEAVKGSLPEDAKLQVLPIEENTEHYKEIEEKLQEKTDSENYNLAGFLAYDVSFVDAEGNEIEPEQGSVKVTFSYATAAIPDAVKENAKADSAEIKVLHFVEDEKGNVTDIVDLTSDSTTSLEATEEKEVQEVSFETESFSDIVFPWILGASSEDLGTVETIDSSSVITMKMVNYPSQQFSGAEWTSSDKDVKQGLLSSTLGEDGYPTFATDKNTLNGTSLNGTSLGQFFDNYSGGTTTANYLFRKDVYEGTDDRIQDAGTYYYDSGYNGAHFDETTGKFEVYNFLTTMRGETSFWAQRGNFLPYNTYDSHTAATDRTNKYDAEGNDLSTTDSMYGKSLYLTDETTTDYYFGMEMDSGFYQYNGGVDDNGQAITFEFNGDDDMWVYIDGVLVLDMGGCHDARSGSINFQTGVVKVQNVDDTSLYEMFEAAGKEDEVKWNADKTTFADSTSHTIKVYYMERGGGASNLKLKFNLQMIQTYDADFTVEKTFTGLTQDEIDSMADDISYTVEAYTDAEDSEEATTAPYDGLVLTLKDDDVKKETLDDGSIKYTWTLPTYHFEISEKYLYRVMEHGGNLDDYVYTFTKTASATEGAELQEDGITVLVQKPETGDGVSATFSFTNDYQQYSSGEDPDNQDSSTSLTHTKTIKADSDNPEQYELALDATGYVKKPENADIVLIVDKSASMSGERLTNVNNAIATMTAKLNEYVAQWRDEDKPTINLSVVEFSSGVTSGSRYESSSQRERVASSSIAQDWTGLSSFDYSLGSVSGGTNWQAGIMTAESLMSKKANDGYKKYVIFLTDGNPTFRYSSDGSAVASTYADSTHYIYGTGSSDNNNNNYTAAVNQWKASTNLQSAKVYVVQAAEDAAKCKTFVSAIYPESGTKYCSYAKLMDGTDAESLTDNFKTIAEEITHGTHFTDVTIHDTLSENVDFAEENPTISVYTIDKDGNENKLDSSKYTATVNTTDKTVDVKFNLDTENYLKDGITYQIRFKVVAKTSAGIDALIKNSGKYGDTGDKGTDAKGNSTSAGKDGLYSNNYDSTYVKYTVDNDDKTDNYKRPVVQINTVSHTVKKIWDSKDETKEPDSVTAVIKAEVNIAEDGSAVDTPRDITSEIFVGQLQGEDSQSLSDENEWTYTWSYLPKYYHYMDANGEDQTTTISYSVSEQSVPSGYVSSKEVKSDPSDASHTITTITNKTYTLPSAGSIGIYPFTIGGVAVIATALLLFIKNKQKEGESIGK